MAIIGIDFGTTKTLVSYFDKKRNELRFIRLGNGRYEIPTSLYFDANGAVIVGEDDDFVVVNEAPRINIKTESYADSKNVDKQCENVSPSNVSNDAQKRGKVVKDNDGCWSLLCRVIGFICIFFCLLFACVGFGIICSIVINIVKTIFSN